MKKEMTLEEQLEYFAHQLYITGEKLGYKKITDKTKWREPVMAGKLGHKAFEKISAGKSSEKYGADAYILGTDKLAEYKTNAIADEQIRKLLEKKRITKKGKVISYKPMTIVGVYNNAFKEGQIEIYDKHEHFFGVFYKEKCLLIIKPDHKYIIETLNKNVEQRKIEIAGGADKSTNLNNVSVNLGDTSLYSVVYRDEEWFAANA